MFPYLRVRDSWSGRLGASAEFFIDKHRNGLKAAAPIVALVIHLVMTMVVISFTRQTLNPDFAL